MLKSSLTVNSGGGKVNFKGRPGDFGRRKIEASGLFDYNFPVRSVLFQPRLCGAHSLH